MVFGRREALNGGVLLDGERDCLDERARESPTLDTSKGSCGRWVGIWLCPSLSSSDSSHRHDDAAKPLAARNQNIRCISLIPLVHSTNDPRRLQPQSRPNTPHSRLSHPLAPPCCCEVDPPLAANSDSCLFCAAICAIVNLGSVAAAALVVAPPPPPNDPNRSEKSDAAFAAAGADGFAVGFNALPKEEVWGWRTGRAGWAWRGT
jgi:hypothetical protein